MLIDHTKGRYAKLCRTFVCAGVGAAVLGGFPLTASAINKAGMSSYRYSISDSGKVATIKPNQSGVSGSLGSVGTIPQGQVGSQIGNTGWYIGASGSGNPSGRSTMNMGHSGDVFFAGSKYPFQAGYQVPKGAFVEAVGMLCKNPVICLGLSLAAPAITKWLSSGGVGINPNEADYPDKPFLLSSEDGCSTSWKSMGKNFCTPEAACRFRASELGMAYDGWYEDGNAVVCRPGYYIFHVNEPVTTKGPTYPASMSDIEPYMDKPDVPADAVSQILEQGGDIQLPSAPTVTGPSQVQGPKQETNNANGTRTVSHVTNNYRTEGNRITNTSTTTVTNTCLGDGTCSPTTTTTTNPEEKPDEDEGDDCKKNPDSLACSQLDTPAGEIPKTTRNVTLQEQELFGGGSCPADRYSNVHGQQMLVWDWQQSCSYISTYMRPVLLLLCAIGAYLIVAGGLKQ